MRMEARRVARQLRLSVDDGRQTAPAREDRARKEKRETWNWKRPAADGAPGARMRRCLKLRQGAGPLRPPAPFPVHWIVGKGNSTSRVRVAAPKNRRALDFFASLPKIALLIMGKGAPVLGGYYRLPLVGPEEGLVIGEGKVYLTGNGLLMEG